MLSDDSVLVHCQYVITFSLAYVSPDCVYSGIYDSMFCLLINVRTVYDMLRRAVLYDVQEVHIRCFREVQITATQGMGKMILIVAVSSFV